LIPWIDGRKMSKSYDNHIPVFDDEKTLKKRIMKIVTGSEGLEDPKDPEKCNVFALIKFFASKKKQDEIAEKYRAWGYGYWHAKLELLDLILEYFKKPREKYNYYMENFWELEKKLEVWNKKVNNLAKKKFEKMKEIIGL